MPTSPSTFKPPWTRRVDPPRGTARQRGYDRAWEKARGVHLGQHPLCVCCLAHGVTMIAELVDHVYPHRGDMVLFWRRDLWQSLCSWCHDNVKKVIELRWLRGLASDRELYLNRRCDIWQPH